MSLFKKNLAVLAVAGMFMFAAPNVRADEWNKRTVVTINEAIQLPTTVLQAGTYVFKLVDSPSDRHIVQVFDKDETHLITTILAIPNWRLRPTGKSMFAFWETPAGQAPAVRAWFYPGDNFGQEFAYPKNMSTQIAASNKSKVVTSSGDDMKTASVTAVNEIGQQNELDDTYKRTDDQVAAAPAPTPEPATAPQEPAPVQLAQAEPAPQPQAAPLPAELPRTGSQMPIIGLIGLLSLGSFLLLARVQGVR